MSKQLPTIREGEIPLCLECGRPMSKVEPPLLNSIGERTVFACWVCAGRHQEESFRQYFARELDCFAKRSKS